MIKLDRKDFLTLKDFTKQEIEDLIDYSIELKEQKSAGELEQKLKNKNIALLFEKSSTRTR